MADVFVLSSTSTRFENQVANFKIPNHGIEFYCDQKTQKWANRETADANDFHITTLSGLKIPIPNFFKTFQSCDAMKKMINYLKDVETHLYALVFGYDANDALLPMFWIRRPDGNNLFCIKCNILTANWDNHEYRDVRGVVYIKDYFAMEKRLAKLEYLFNRVCEKSSLINTLIQTAEEVEKEETQSSMCM